MTRAELNNAKLQYAQVLRAKGLSNQQIAKAVGWHPTTVLKHLGPQPKSATVKAQKRGWMKRRKNQLIRQQPFMVNAIYQTQLHQTNPTLCRIEQARLEDSAALARLYKKLEEMILAEKDTNTFDKAA